MADLDKLYQINFSKTLINDGVDLAKILLKLPKGEKPAQNDKDDYVHQVWDSFTELQRIVESLDMAEIFLKSYSTSKAWRNKYDQNHYFTYHYEMWIINGIRLYERLLILINSVYWLEIDHREVSYKSVAQHPKLKGTETLKVLNKVHGAMKSLQGTKNSVFHRYIYTDDELGNIAQFNLLARNSDGDIRKKFTAEAKLEMRLFYLPKKQKEVQKNNGQLLTVASSVLDTLEKQYISERDDRG